MSTEPPDEETPTDNPPEDGEFAGYVHLTFQGYGGPFDDDQEGP